jgi:GT2 family glycosyltransferase
MHDKVSIVMTGRNRTPLLERTLAALCFWQTFPRKAAEFVYVDDQSDQPDELKRILKRFQGFFYKTTLVHMDKRRSEIPVAHNSPALGINLGVKMAENEIIYKTDPECLPITETVNFALKYFDPSLIWFASTRILTVKETEKFELIDKAHPLEIQKGLVNMPELWYISERSRLAYWFGAIFSRSLHMSIGGVDEEFLRGFAGEDDDWAERMVRAGAAWRWSEGFQILHQYHGSDNDKWHHSQAHLDNINRLKLSRAEVKIQVNLDREWASDKVVLATEVL